jgi:hypothetical protein
MKLKCKLQLDKLVTILNAINQSGGSEGATRAAILGVGANATRGFIRCLFTS